jgi:prepilin-type N-terminal cleavage/methylation domain-containing protein
MITSTNNHPAVIRPNRIREIHSAPRGFSLIELLIVVAIILIIAAIAIPNLMRARITANESLAVQNLRTITTASVAYFSTYGNGFPPALINLGGNAPVTCAGAGLIDNFLANGQKSGYSFTYLGGVPRGFAGPGCAGPGFFTYTLNADPLNPGTSGQRTFYTDQTGVIRFRNDGAAAGPGDPALQ